MLTPIRKTAAAAAALAALGLGGAAIAGAAADKSTSASGSSQTRDARPQREALSSEVAAKVKAAAGARRVVLVNASFEATAVQAERARGGRGRGHHRGGETALTGETKDKVEAAVLAEYPGAEIVRTETNGDSAAPYESHITTSAGKELEVLVSKAFEVVDAREHPARP